MTPTLPLRSRLCRSLLAAGLFAAALLPGAARAASPQWEALLDPTLSQWDIFMGAPHTTTAIEGYPKFADVTKGTPIGLNLDPKKVFTTRQENGEIVLVVSGEIFAGLVTKKEYENYHLSVQFKWGEKKWEPRLALQRNSGVLYHSVGKNTDFWNVWMTSLEAEVMERDTADYISIGKVRARIPATGSGKKYTYTPGASPVSFAWMEGYPTGRCLKPGDPEKPHGQWNTLEIICLGRESFHVFNGVVVMHLLDAEVLVDSEWKPMTKGKIQLQSEAAEVFYKDIRIAPIAAWPAILAGHTR